MRTKRARISTGRASTSSSTVALRVSIVHVIDSNYSIFAIMSIALFFPTLPSLKITSKTSQK
jgi:hypothetical protein